MPLAVLPTPLVRAPRLAEALGLASLLVKRDDLTGFAVAGNKARQLQQLLEQAQAEHAEVLVTGGTAGSNFIQAAAAAAAFADLRCMVVLAGPPVQSASHPNLAAAVSWGAEVRFTGDTDRASVDRELPVVAAELAATGTTAYVCPRGGASPLGALGYRLAMNELLSQLGGETPVVVVAAGAGGTLAGLVAGAVATGRSLRIVGASVSRPPREIHSRVLALSRQVAALRGEPPPQADDVVIIDARGPGFGMASPEGDLATALALRKAGLLLDPVYTAKALAVLPTVAAGRPALFWHTGGLLDAVARFLSTADAATDRTHAGPA